MENIFSAPTFIFLKFFPLSVSSDLVGFPLAISDADCARDGVVSSLTDVSDDPGDPTEVLERPEDLDLSECEGSVGAIERVVCGEGVNSDGDLAVGDEAWGRVGVLVGVVNDTGGDFGRRNLLVLFRRLNP